LDRETRNAYLSMGIVLLGGPIGRDEAAEVLSRIEYLKLRNPAGEVRLLINSPGGMVNCSLAIYKEMMVLDTVATGCAGMADGSAAMLLAAGTRGRRSAMAHSVIHVADVWSTCDGPIPSGKASQIGALRDRLIGIWTNCTGERESVIRRWMTEEKRFDAEEALAAGIIDFVVPQGEECGGDNGDLLGLFHAGQD
jgi:ATP-dependent Clp protease protease subunit